MTRLLGFVGGFLVVLAEAVGSTNQLAVRTFSLTQYAREYDGQWQGVTVAADGNCYFAVSSHSDRQGAGFFRYDPRTATVTVLAQDVSRLCGGDPPRTVPHGKIHSPLVEANGWIYFATHLGMWNDEGKARFDGSHILGYELATGRFRDYGVVRPGYTVYSAIAADPKRQVLYVFVMPLRPADIRQDGSHLYRLDLRTGRRHDLGLVRPGGTEDHACFWMFVDARGDCWFTLKNENGALFRARAGTGRLARWNNVLPAMRLGPHAEGLFRQEQRHWTWAQAWPGRDRCLFAMGLYEWARELNRHVFYGDEFLWAFDPTQPIEAGRAFTKLGYLGPNFLGLTANGARVYCVQPALGNEPETAMPPTKPTRVFERRKPPLLLRSVAVADPSRINDHGQIVDQAGRRGLFCEALAADGAGRVYLVADFTVLPGEPTVLRYHERRRTYHDEPRALFFAVAETP